LEKVFYTCNLLVGIECHKLKKWDSVKISLCYVFFFIDFF
jgi:hypothetical protein